MMAKSHSRCENIFEHISKMKYCRLQEKNATATAPDQPGFPSSSLKVISTGLPASTGTMNQRPGESVDDGRYKNTVPRECFFCNRLVVSCLLTRLLLYHWNLQENFNEFSFLRALYAAVVYLIFQML